MVKLFIRRLNDDKWDQHKMQIRKQLHIDEFNPACARRHDTRDYLMTQMFILAQK